MGKELHTDPVMGAVVKRFQDAKLTYAQLGEKMGYAPSQARQSAWRFLKSGDPQISMLRKFADAMGISLNSLLRD